MDVPRLRSLLEASFGRVLDSEFFERPLLAAYIEPNYRGVALLLAELPVPYLSKFAVEPEAQGEGIGNDVWHAVIRDFPSLFWRSRPDNPINAWYQTICDGMLRLPQWNVFFRGVAPDQIPALVRRAEELPQDFIGAATAQV
jgi:acetylglutamate kinase